MIEPSGIYFLGGTQVEITAARDAWNVVFSGVPRGFEPRLIRIDETTFRIERGPLEGSSVTFDSPTEAHMGPLPLLKVEGPYESPSGCGLVPPPYGSDPERDRAFQELLETTPAGTGIDWGLEYPKHEFVRWAQGLDRFIFHSSTNTGIGEFVPIRTSMELADHGNRGNLSAVYGTHDGYWSMFFAVVDRSSLRGSMRSGVYSWEAPDGRTTTTYQFSLEQGTLKTRPFTNGATYLLPRDTFRRLPFYPGGPPSDEWVSEQPVRPVVSLSIEPEDFPFLDRIGGHDEAEYLGMVDRLREVLMAMTGCRSAGTEIVIEITWSDDVDGSFERWSALAGRYLPSVGYRLEGDGPARNLTLRGPKPYLDDVKAQIEEIVKGR